MPKIPESKRPKQPLAGGFELVHDGENVALFNGDLLCREPANDRSKAISAFAQRSGLAEAEVDRALQPLEDAASAVIDRLDMPSDRTERQGNPADVWNHRETLRDYLANIVEVPEGLAQDFVFPGGVTTIAAPSSSGKSIVIYALADALARGGIFRHQRVQAARVLLVDFDNPRSIVQKRLQSICDNPDIDFQIMGREHAPQLLNQAAWAAMPAHDHDVVIIDSFGSATVGVTEKEGRQLQQALDTLLKVADRGPAVIVLDNTEKTASTYRGRGEKTERVDVFYEVRDITDWTPPQGDQWWRHIPSAGDAEWQERAARKAGQDKLRVAFVCRKFRWDEEPAPFALELNFSTQPWTLSDVTEDVEAAGRQATVAEKEARQKQLADAAAALAAEIGNRQDAMSKSDAEVFLRTKCGLKRDPARNLLVSFDDNTFPGQGRWQLQRMDGSHGGKIGVFPLTSKSGGVKMGNDNLNKNNDTFGQSFRRPLNTGTAERCDSETRINTGFSEGDLSAAVKNDSRGEDSLQREDGSESAISPQAYDATPSFHFASDNGDWDSLLAATDEHGILNACQGCGAANFDAVTDLCSDCRES